MEEAEFLLDQINGYNVKFSLAFDMEEIPMEEERINILNTEERTQIALAFCETIKYAGYTPMIYGNNEWFFNLYDLSEIIKYNIWYAEYKDTPTFDYKFQMWQYTNQGHVNGISENVDLNLYFNNCPTQ